jgi:hypothetical protein
MTLARSFLALALAQLAGALLRALPSLVRGRSPRHALAAPLTAPTSALVALALLHGASLGLAGTPLLLALVAALAWPLRSGEDEAIPSVSKHGLALAAVLFVALVARPLVPTSWDEFVWLGKARFESEGFGAGVRAALEPHAHLMPPGYPTLWPAASGWLALGADDLAALTAGATVVVFLAFVTFGERLLAGRTFAASGATRFLGVSLVIAAPLVIVHARTTYVDLPLGLLGAALFLELAAATPSPAVAASLAVILVGLKDEGAAHLLASLLGALAARAPSATKRSHALAFAALAGVLTLVTWQALVSAHGIGRDHGGFTPNLRWALALPLLVAKHAFEITSWGFFWPAALAAAFVAHREARARAVLVALAINLACVVAMLVVGPPRVRAFAENGTLLNRVLVQLWPLAVALVLEAVTPVRRPSRP